MGTFGWFDTILTLFLTGNPTVGVLQWFHENEQPLPKEEETMNGIGRTLTGLLVCLTLLGCAGCSGQSMSIQSSLPPHSSATPAETKSTPPGKQGDLPGTENGYLVQEPMGEEVQVDLDGDGKLETLTITTKQVEQKSGDSRWKETVLSSLVIDGKEFIKKNAAESNSLNVPNVVLYTPEGEHYFLADLNASDGKLEIALLDYGPSYDLTTTYLRYENSQLTSLGTVPGFPDQDSSILDGKGNVTTPGRLSLLQNWQAPFVYQLKGNALEKAPQSWYTPIDQSEQQVVLKKAIKLYTKPDQKAQATTAQPNQAVTAFPATDNKHWVQVQLADGTEGWFYMEDSATIVSGNQKYTEMEVFDNLNMTD